ncbi:MAG: hypothetical protein EOM22_03455 [Gammaproteobacteria bacterium]|nr:hypothetical protein [Gammaproteobacteria bacterium]
MNRSTLFGAVYAANIVVLIPIILAGRLYIDDHGRSINGHFGWTSDGRPLATLLYYIVNLGSPAINIFPLTQILAAALISGVALILSNLLEQRKPLLLVLGSMPLAAQPYFLQNLSYAYDSITMSAGLFCSVAGAYVILTYKRPSHLILSVVLVVSALSLYQATLAVYFVVLVYFVLRHAARAGWLDHPNLKHFGLGLLALMTGLAFYLTLLKIFPFDNPYAASRTQIWSSSEMLRGILVNTLNYWRLLYYDWRGTWPGFFAVTIALLGIFAASWPLRDLNQRPTSLAQRGFVALSLIALVIFSFGLLLLIENPVMAPRSFIALGVLGALFSLEWIDRIEQSTSIKARKSARVMMYLPVVLMAFSLVVVAYAYGRASVAQKEFEMSLLTRLVYDIESFSVVGDVGRIGFSGRLPESPILQKSREKFPVIGRLVPIHIVDNWWWGHVQLKHFGLQLDYYDAPKNLVETMTHQGELPIRVTRSYRIYKFPGQLLVVF